MTWLLKRPLRWLLIALAVPLGIAVADAIAGRIEDRRGASAFTRALRMPGRWRHGDSLLAE